MLIFVVILVKNIISVISCVIVLPGSKHRSPHSEGRIETQINIFENCLVFANIFACLKVSELFSLIKKKF